MSLLTSSSKQYLQPDYLQPLSSSLDSKQSPLALLAQTCNNIGKDLSSSECNAKPVSLTLDSKDKKRSKDMCDKNGRTSSSGMSSDFSPKESSVKDYSMRDKISSSKDHPNLSSRKNGSPVHVSMNAENGKRNEPRDSHAPLSVSTSPVKDDRGSGERGKTTCGSPGSALFASSAVNAKHDSLLSSSSSLASYYSSLAMYGYPGLLGHPSLGYSLPGPMATAALLAAHKPGAEGLKYTPIKTISGATTMVPICSDPLCVHCKLAVQSAQLTPVACPAGCTQCNHDKVPISGGLPLHSPPVSLPTGLLGIGGGYPGLCSLPSFYGQSGGNGASSPYVCSWISSAGVCGKRFVNADELMQHLRSHTASLDSSSLPYPNLPGLYPPTSLLAPGAVGMNSAAVAALRHCYPRSYSPTSILSASRFHPYLKASSSGLNSESTYPPGFGGALSAYSHLYSLYGSKLGVP